MNNRSWQYLVAACCTLACGTASALPYGAQISSGGAQFSVLGNVMTIEAADATVIEWTSFDIAAGETVSFLQPSLASTVWNRLPGGTMNIAGTLSWNGVLGLYADNIYIPGTLAGSSMFIEAEGNIVIGGNLPLVPEPETYAMLAIGLPLLIGIARRRRAV